MNGVEYDDSILGKDLHKLKKAIAIKPDFNQGHINLGLALLERGDLREGLQSIYGIEGLIKFNSKNYKVIDKLCKE